MDRRSVEQKAVYFRETLGIDWFDGKIVPILAHVINERNAILHNHPDRLVDRVIMQLTHVVCVAIPWVSVVQAAVLYPDGFEMIGGVSEDEVRRVFLKGKGA